MLFVANLGFNIDDAGLAALFAVPAAPLLWVYGRRLRLASKYAKKD